MPKYNSASSQASSASSRVTIYWDQSIQAYKCIVPYNPSFVELIKHGIPASDRSYDPLTKVWIFMENYFDAVKAICDTLFGAYSITATKKTTSQAQSPNQAYQNAQTNQQGNNSPWGVQRNTNSDNLPLGRGLPSPQELALQFLRLVPHKAMKKAYLLAIQELHPDKPENSGNASAAEKATDLNSKWDLIEKEIYKV